MASPSVMQATDGGSHDGPAACPHLGTDVLAHVVAFVCASDDGAPARDLRRSLRQSSRALRDLVDAATDKVAIQVDCSTVGSGSPLHEDHRRLLGRLHNVSSVSITSVATAWARPPLHRGESEETSAWMAAGGVQRVLIAVLPAALPEGGMQRITHLHIDGDDFPLSPGIALAIRAALPRLQQLCCRLDAWTWAGRLLGTAALQDLPPTLQRLCLPGSTLGPDNGAALSRLTALTELEITTTGLETSFCRSVAAVSSLRSLEIEDAAPSARVMGSDRLAADLRALSALVHLTYLCFRAPCLAEHLPLAHLSSLVMLESAVADVDAFAEALATPALDRLRRLRIRLFNEGGDAAAAGDGGGAWHAPEAVGGAQQAPGAAVAATAADSGAAAAAVAARPPLLPGLQELKLWLPLRCPRQLSRVVHLMLGLSVGNLRKLTIWEDPNAKAPTPDAAAACQAVLYPLMTPALARFTALQSLSWEVPCGPAVVPPPPWDELLPPGCGGTFADVVRAMPRLREVAVGTCESEFEEGWPVPPPRHSRAWLTDEALEALASQAGSQLRHFSMDYAAHVTAAGVRALLRMPGLRSVCVKNCPLVPGTVREELGREALERACQGA